MKPAWDTLAEEYAGSTNVLIADVDCTAAGEPLCERFGIEGFPTIKVFNPPDEDGEDYEGGRELDELQEFVLTLGPGCSPSTRDNCSADELKQLDETLAMSDADRVAELLSIQEDLTAKEKAHAALLESLQAQFDESNKALEADKKAAKPRIKQLKMAGTKLPETEVKEEL